MARLCRDTLSRLPAAVRRPGFDPRDLTTGIVHIGVGAFHRAHQAFYTEPLLARDPSWGTLGISLRHPDTRDALEPQDWLYTLAERDTDGERLSVMGTLTGVLVAPEDPRQTVARLADPAIRIVTITVTEKGYFRNAASGALEAADASIRRDLAQPDTPATLPGLIVAALKLRRAAGIPPFTVLSCDNLPANGAATRRVLTEYAALLEPGLARFIEREVSCLASVLDRIVPATTDADRAHIFERLGVEDAWPVVAERFSQWVIEDRFPLGRPAWEKTGATLVADVAPYAAMKLRLLNGSHSTIAYLGQLAGWRTVADAMAEPALVAHIEALIRELATTLDVAPGMDVAAHRAALVARFANPALQHLTGQIAMDGSQKMPQRLFAPALDRLAAGKAARRIALGAAAWLRYLQGSAENGETLQISDPLTDRLAKTARAARDHASLVDAIFAMEDIVPPALAAAATFRADVLTALVNLSAHGVRATLKDWTD
jgi:fructuronate reductase